MEGMVVYAERDLTVTDQETHLNQEFSYGMSESWISCSVEQRMSRSLHEFILTRTLQRAEILSR
jgi:hypothetical protein